MHEKKKNKSSDALVLQSRTTLFVEYMENPAFATGAVRPWCWRTSVAKCDKPLRGCVHGVSESEDEVTKQNRSKEIFLLLFSSWGRYKVYSDK